jgi:hypothetical protein
MPEAMTAVRMIAVPIAYAVIRHLSLIGLVNPRIAIFSLVTAGIPAKSFNAFFRNEGHHHQSRYGISPPPS